MIDTSMQRQMANTLQKIDPTNRRMRFLVRDENGADLVSPVEVAIPTVLSLKIAKLYLPDVTFKTLRAKLPDALKAMGFK